MVKNFRYEEEDAIALSAAPQTPEEIDWLKEQGISAIVSLHPIPQAVQNHLAESGIIWRPFLITDWASGVPGGISELFEFIKEQSEDDPSVLIHCQGGGGRAGTFYAAYLVHQGVPVENAMDRVPGVTRDEQKAFLHGLAAGLALRPRP